MKRSFENFFENSNKNNLIPKSTKQPEATKLRQNTITEEQNPKKRKWVETSGLLRESRRQRNLPPEVEMKENPESNNKHGNGNFRETLSSEETGKYAIVYKKTGRYNILSPDPKDSNSRPIEKAFFSPTKGNSVLPSILETPGGTQLKEFHNHNALALFTEKAKVKRVLFGKPEKAEELEEKKFSIELTPEIIAESKKEIAQNGGGRICTQSYVMQDSANNKAIENNAKNYEDEKWEWLHLIAHRFLANKAQVSANLVAGTYHANTAMLLVAENHIEKIIREHGKVNLDVTAMVRPGTDVAERINYNIKVEGNDDIMISFDARQKTRSSKVIEKNAGRVFDKLLKSSFADIENTRKSNQLSVC